ncbi:hypothetical protein F8388_024130 [Cannabis sativa]|uniref:DUF4283 domain-containing protein n=1 Tax=Cannabis sativa TaxID=3483 RepID=A0A7J6FXI8_CANSA|nr:hypothetical protein F8388_024130 [Cannabis sativa]
MVGWNYCIHYNDEEEHVVSLADDCEEVEDLNFDDKWCLIGRLLFGKVSDFQIFQNIMADLWKPGKGIFIKRLEQNRFLFQFYHEIDIQRVLDGSPWTYDRKQLLIERLKPGKEGATPARQSAPESPTVNASSEIRGMNVANCDPHGCPQISHINSPSRAIGNQQSTLKEHVILVNDTSAVSLTNLAFSSSDHSPIFLVPASMDSGNSFALLRYENSWNREPFCAQLVADIWHSSHHIQLTDKLAICLKQLVKWGSSISGEHTASTDNLFGVFGQGSAPKLELDAVTEHAPFWKLPQLPVGVPKLAKLMAEMEYPALQCRRLQPRSRNMVPELTYKKEIPSKLHEKEKFTIFELVGYNQPDTLEAVESLVTFNCSKRPTAVIFVSSSTEDMSSLNVSHEYNAPFKGDICVRVICTLTCYEVTDARYRQ